MSDNWFIWGSVFLIAWQQSWNSPCKRSKLNCFSHKPWADMTFMNYVQCFLVTQIFEPNRSTLGWNLMLTWKKNMLMCHVWHVTSDPFVEFVIIWNKWRRWFLAQCAHWHGNECFPLIMHQFIAECDPAHEYLTACFPYLHPSHTPLHTIYISLFLSLFLDFFSPSIVRFQEFPLGVVQVIRLKQMAVLSFFPVWFFIPPPPNHLISLKTSATKYHSEISVSTLIIDSISSQHTTNSCLWLCVHLKFWPLSHWSWPLNSLVIMRPRPPIISPGSRRKLALVTQWSMQPWRGPLLQSHGRLHGLMGPCELYFLTNFSFPEAHHCYTGHMLLKCQQV